ncbi:hypothetical protein [Massilia sp. TSP1-1-2]|uniref:hypothetical protein n=1 Tax=Massilia sp. TSP1-1-2 TaxID=2804649 RepID=UPI003CED161E
MRKPPLCDDEIVRLLIASNMEHVSKERRTTRWPEGMIKVRILAPSSPTGMRYSPLVDDAISTTNRTLGFCLLGRVDRGAGDIRVAFDTASEPSKGKTYQEYAANVSDRAGSGELIICDSSGVMSAPVWINIGHAEHETGPCNCKVNVETVIHEFGHALGLERHFDGFGEGPAISPAFWAVLAKLYTHRPECPFDDLAACHIDGSANPQGK